MAEEIELKLALDAEGALRLKRSPLLAGLRPVRQQLQSIYYDTPDFRLLRQGAALRVRRVGRRWLQTVKAEAPSVGALTRRPEWEVPVASGRPDITCLPAPARAFFPPDLVAALTPCFSTRFTRTSWHLGEGENRLELALDRGEIEAAGGRLPIAEIELELLAGSPVYLYDVAEQLATELTFQLEPRSKAERGYRLAGALKAGPVKARPPALAPDDAPLQAWRAMAGAALAQFTANVPGLLSEDDPEYVHQARVAIRRLLTVADMAKSLDRPRPHWRRDLRTLMTALAAAREWDVFVTELLPALTGLAPELHAQLERRAAQAQLRARARARAAVRAPDCVRLVLAVGRSLVPDPARDEEKGKVRQWARRLLERRLKRLKRLGKGFERLDARGRHRVRIAAKRLRYVADAFAPLYGAPAKTYLDRLAGLQDKLGAANDAVMARQLVGELKLRGARGASIEAEFERALEAQLAWHSQGLAEAWREFIQATPFWCKKAAKSKT